MKVIEEGEDRVGVGDDLIGSIKVAESVIILVCKEFLNSSTR